MRPAGAHSVRICASAARCRGLTPHSREAIQIATAATSSAARDGLRAALTEAREDLLLVETDAPFLTPHPWRGRPNAPYLVPLTLRGMAETRGLDADVLAAAVANNTRRVYGGF